MKECETNVSRRERQLEEGLRNSSQDECDNEKQKKQRIHEMVPKRKMEVYIFLFFRNWKEWKEKWGRR